MNNFHQGLLKYYSAEQLAKVRSAQVGIAGAGGLGSNIAVNLVRSGLEKLTIIDFDVIEWSNLNRQYYFYSEVGQSKVVVLKKRLLEINPDCQLTIFPEKLTADNADKYFQDDQIIFEAFDKADNKKLFLEAYGNTGKLLIMGNGMAGLTNDREIKIKKVKDNLFIVGDGATNVGKDSPPFAPRVSVCAGLMSSVSLERILWAK